MSRKGTRSIAEPILQLQRELEEYRRMQPTRAKLPESIWEAAELAGAHGVYAVAQTLRLDYMRLLLRTNTDSPSMENAEIMSPGCWLLRHPAE